MARGSGLCEGSSQTGQGVMSAEQVEHLFALAIGFAIAGLIASGYQLVTRRPASFRLLQRGPRPSTFAAVPLLAFAAPFIIMRNTIRGRRIEGRGFSMVMVATIIAGCWSLMSGTVVVMALTSLGIPAG
jgi:uncharacterized protein DUF6949